MWFQKPTGLLIVQTIVHSEIKHHLSNLKPNMKTCTTKTVFMIIGDKCDFIDHIICVKKYFCLFAAVWL